MFSTANKLKESSLSNLMYKETIIQCVYNKVIFQWITLVTFIALITLKVNDSITLKERSPIPC